MKLLLRLPLFWKVLAPPAISVLCLVLYLGFSTVVFKQNNTRLENVRDVHFPVLEAMTENVAALDKVISTLNSAAASGDADLLQTVDEIAGKIRGNYAKLQRTDAADAERLQRLASEFDAYYTTAHDLAQRFVNKAEPDPKAAASMGSLLDTYRQDLTSFRETANKRFSETVGDATASADRATVTGIIVGLLGLAASLGFGLAIARSISGPLRRAMEVADAVAAGKLDNQIKIKALDECGQLLQAMKTMQEQLTHFIAAQQEMTRLHEEGDIDHQMPADQFPGVYGRMAKDMNELVQSHIAVKMRVVEVVKHYADGDLSVDMDRLPGKKARVTDAVDSVKASLTAINGEIRKLVEAAAAGNFKERGDATKYKHDFRRMVEGLNQLMETSDVGLSDVARVLQALSRGDLTDKIEGDYQGTFDQLKEDANATVDKLNELVRQIKDTTDAINTASSEIASGNSDLSQRTEEQASSLQQTASSMEQLTGTVRQNAENAHQANQLAIGASEIAVKGGAVVSEVVDTMSSINESSKKIVDIIGVIDGIAFQTNILALNAAVEAARAGEQGRGFAVVATEVRNLAQRSAAAAKEIKALIGDSVDKVDTGTKLVDQAGHTMQEIVASVKRVTDIMAEITAASQEQSAGIAQVSQAVAQMDEATQQNAALVEEAAASAESLQDQAGTLAQAVGAFKLVGGERGTSLLATERRDFATRPANVARLSKVKSESRRSLPARAAAAIAGGAPADEQWEEF